MRLVHGLQFLRQFRTAVLGAMSNRAPIRVKYQPRSRSASASPRLREGRAAAPHRDVESMEVRTHGATFDAELSGQLVRRLTGEVAIHQRVNRGSTEPLLRLPSARN